MATAKYNEQRQRAIDFIQSQQGQQLAQQKGMTQQVNQAMAGIPTQQQQSPVTSTDPNIPDYLKYTRQAPTVATPQQPVVSKTTTQDLAYDPTNPEDYLMRLQARSQATGKAPTEMEYYNAMLAQRAMQQSQTQQDPYAEYLKQLQEEQTRLQAEEKTRDETELEAYRKSLQASYDIQKGGLLESATRQKESAQGVYSFSGFGRSTKAADTMVKIQKDTDQAIDAMNQAMQAEIIRKQMELAGADGKILEGITQQINQLRQKAFDWQADAIAQTAIANQKSGASYMEAINNIMLAAQKGGMNLDVKGFEQAALAMKGMTPEQQQQYLTNFSEQEALLLQGLANSGTGEAPEVKNMGTAKNPRWVQWNGKDREPITAAQAARVGGGGGGGGGGGSLAGVGPAGLGGYDARIPATVFQAINDKPLDANKYAKDYGLDAVTLRNQANAWKIDQLKPGVSKSLTATGFVSSKYPGRAAAISSQNAIARMANPELADFYREYMFIKNNLAFDKLTALKQQGATFGALSDPERIAIGEAADALNIDMSPEKFKEKISIIEQNLRRSIASVSSAADTATTPAAGTAPGADASDADILAFLNS